MHFLSPATPIETYALPLDEPAKEWEVQANARDEKPMNDILVDFAEEMTFLDAYRQMLSEFTEGISVVPTYMQVVDGLRQYGFDLVFDGKVFGDADITECEPSAARRDGTFSQCVNASELTDGSR
ncbi:hypothetical protein [Nocardia sp. XZ_19_231]|uniref:hypothetical protein n=1 Tax=Nocardia sp. XZ_19_231 TaxID=2769252 RepID=UPI001890AE29|nr:hypothetical protein [Nocardia sp. XZ_19_231]